MREFLSKSIAAGLSAGVVLLWWPVLFAEVDTVTSWLVRGAVWTVLFELLVVALVPFERALWETAHGERITRRVGDAGSRLHSGSSRRRFSRLTVVATAAIAVPVVLLVAGLQNHAPALTEAAPTKIVRVTKVVRPVTVKRVVERTPVQVAPAPVQAAPTPVSPRATEDRPARERTVVGDTAPVERESAPKAPVEPAPESAPRCQGEACGSSLQPVAVG